MTHAAMAYATNLSPLRPGGCVVYAPLRRGGRRRPGAARREGAVMLVVLLLLMIATAAASVSVQATQYELQAAGNERNALQAKYIAEANLLTTIAWLDKVFDPETGGGFSQFYTQCASGTAPQMWRYGQPEIDTTTHSACRLSWLSMRNLDPLQTSEVTPVSRAVPVSGSVPEGQATPDYLGSLGPRQAYQPQLAGNPDLGPDFVTDIVCRPEAVEEGTVVGGTMTTTRTRRWYCEVIARATTVLAGAAPAPRSWTVGNATYAQNRFATYHEMRMTLLTPEEVY